MPVDELGRKIEDNLTAKELTLKMTDAGPEDLELIGDRYLIEEVTIEHWRGGLLLAGEDPSTIGWRAGFVRAVGDGARLENNENIAMRFQVGDFIIFERQTGRETGFGGKRYRVVNQSHTYGRIAKYRDVPAEAAKAA